MITFSLTQGSPEWHRHRATHFNASDAPAMMGCSPYKTRTQLLKEFKTGIVPDVDAATQSRFDDGHRFEYLARSLAEEIIGEELYPVVGTEGKYSASFDGLTMMEDIAFEHKTLNDTLRAVGSIEELPRAYKVQMEQQLLVSGADKCLFMASKWDESGELIEEKHFWYEANGLLRIQIVDGWSQFEDDLETFEPEPEVIPAKADPVMALPSLAINVGGSISIQSNLDKFGERLKSFIEEANAKPETDTDFANLEQACKVLKDAEDALKQAESNALAQTASVDEMRRTVSFLADMARTNRLQFEKIVKSEKENRKARIVATAKASFSEHYSKLQAEIPVVFNAYMPNFADAIKGKKTLSSMQDAVNTMLANAKIDADALARDLREKHAWYIENAGEYSFLFSDLSALIYKQADDFKAVANNRIAQHKEQERIKAEAAAKEQAEREEQIRKEAADKARREEQQRIAAEQAANKMAEEQANVVGVVDTGEQESGDQTPIVQAVDVPDNKEQDEQSNTMDDSAGKSPSRFEIINAVADKFTVSFAVAQDWIVQEFR